MKWAARKLRVFDTAFKLFRLIALKIDPPSGADLDGRGPSIQSRVNKSWGSREGWTENRQLFHDHLNYPAVLERGNRASILYNFVGEAGSSVLYPEVNEAGYV